MATAEEVKRGPCACDWTCNSTLCYRRCQSLIFVPKTTAQGVIYITIGALLEILPFYSASEVYFNFNTPRMVYLLVFALGCLYIFILPGVRVFFPDKSLLCLKSLNDVLNERGTLEEEEGESRAPSPTAIEEQPKSERMVTVEEEMDPASDHNDEEPPKSPKAMQESSDL